MVKFAMIKLALFPLFAIAQISIAQAAPVDCAKPEDVQKFYKEFQIEDPQKDLPMDNLPGIPAKVCSESPMVERLIKATQLIDLVSQGPQAESSLWSLGEKPGAYLRQRVKTIVLDDPRFGGPCRSGGTVAFAHPKVPGIITICKAPNVYELDVLSFTQTLLHEARHLDGEEYQHVKCDKQPYKNSDSQSRKGSCDASLEAFGSYGVGAAFLHLVSRSEVVGQELRSQAKAQLLIDLAERFNTLPLKMKPMAALQTKDDRLYFYDGELAGEIKVSSGLNGILTTRRNLLTFFTSQGEVKSEIFADSTIQAGGSFAAHFRNNDFDTDRALIKDIFLSFEMSCVLFEAKLDCMNNHLQSASISLKNIRGKVVEQDGQGYNLYDDQGTVYPLPATIAEMSQIREGDLKAKKVDYVSSAVVGGKRVMIEPEGRLLGADKADLLKGLSFKKIIYPLYWSPELTNL